LLFFGAALAVLPSSTRITPDFQYALNIPFPDHNLRAVPHTRKDDSQVLSEPALECAAIHADYPRGLAE